MIINSIYTKPCMFLLGAVSLALIAPDILAEDKIGVGGLAENVTSNFENIGKLLVSMAYVAGIGFGIAAIFKFKQHKDNPTQITIGTPFALLGVSVMLVFLPGLYKPLGETVYGKEGGETGGFTGSGADKISGK